MKKHLLTLLVITSTLCFNTASLATTLAEAYRQALASDPTFKTAEAQWQAAQQLAPISRSYLLPQLTSSASADRGYVVQSFDEDNASFYQNVQQFALNLNQAIFNYQAWSGLKNANAQVKQAQANYDYAVQDLILRVASAYLAVLQAYDQLLATQAQKTSLTQQLKQTQDQFDVGLIAITGLEQVKASFDSTLALEIADKNNIANKLEELRAITGVFYVDMQGISPKLPLVVPNPQNINSWVAIATKQSYAIKSAYYAMVAARENVKMKRAGHFPTVNATAGYSYDNQSESFLGGTSPTPNTNSTTSVGVTVSLPVYQGGLVNAQTRQAAAQYAEASAQLEQTYRGTLTQTREAYLGVISGVNKLKADRQAIVSSQTSLNSTKSGYTAGTQTIVDVLQQQSNVYNSQSNYATDRYNYLISLLTLKQSAGTLSPKDIAILNTWLNQPIDFSAYDFNVHQIAYSEADMDAIQGEKPKKNNSQKHQKARKAAKAGISVTN